jgi:hypothetical protein
VPGEDVRWLCRPRGGAKALRLVRREVALVELDRLDAAGQPTDVYGTVAELMGMILEAVAAPSVISPHRIPILAAIVTFSKREVRREL